MIKTHTRRAPVVQDENRLDRESIIATILRDYPAMDQSINAMCEHGGINYGTFRASLDADPELAAAWDAAKRARAHNFVQAALIIADDDSADMVSNGSGGLHNTPAVARAKLRINAYLWAAKALAPDEWGDRQIVDNRGATMPVFVIGDSSAAAAIIDARRQAIRAHAADAEIVGDTKDERPE